MVKLLQYLPLFDEMKGLKQQSAGQSDTSFIGNIFYPLLYVTQAHTKQEIYSWDVYKAPMYTDYVYK